MSSRVDAWFDLFSARLMDRIRRTDWPLPGSEYWAALRRRAIHHGLRESEADAATDLLTDSPPCHLDRVWPSLLAAVQTIRASQQLQSSDAMGSFVAARAASLDCPYCSGEGRVSTWKRESRSQPAAALCLCPAGRYLGSTLDTDLARRSLRLETRALPDGRSEVVPIGPNGETYLLDPPDSDSVASSDDVPLRELKKRLAASVATREQASGIPGPAESRTTAPRVATRETPSIGVVVQFLVGMLAEKPSGLKRILECAELENISPTRVYEAAYRIDVVKTYGNDDETWGLESRQTG